MKLVEYRAQFLKIIVIDKVLEVPFSKTLGC